VAWVALHLRDREWIARARSELIDRGRAEIGSAVICELDGYLALLAEDWPAAEAEFAAALEAGASGCTPPCLLALARAHQGDHELARRFLARERFGPKRAVRCPDPRCADVAILVSFLSSVDGSSAPTLD
jgi:hypothetical protein